MPDLPQFTLQLYWTDRGTLRTDGDELRPQATQFPNSGFTVTVTEAAVVHGYYTGAPPEADKPEPASLLVFHWKFGTGGARKYQDGRQMHGIEFSVRFEASAPVPCPPEYQPYIAGYYPEHTLEFDRLAVENVTNDTTSKEMSANISHPAFSLGGRGSTQNTSSKKFDSKVASMWQGEDQKTSHYSQRRGSDKITWSLADNGETSSMPDVVATAVGIKRPVIVVDGDTENVNKENVENADFTITFEIKSVIDSQHRWEQRLQRLSSMVKGVLSRAAELFDLFSSETPNAQSNPHTKLYRAKEDGHVPSELGDRNWLRKEVIDEENKYALRKYVFFHKPEETEPIRFLPLA